MFERFTEPARQVVVLAQEECRLLRHAEMEPEHLLIGLLQEGEGVAAQVLAASRISKADAREEVLTITGQGIGATDDVAPLSAATTEVMNLALAEAMELGHSYVGTEHILLALTRGGGTAGEVLVRLGAEPDVLRGKVLGQLARADPLPVVHADDVVMGATPPDPAALLTTEDVEAVLRDHDLVGLRSSGTTNVEGVGHRWSTIYPLSVPTAWLAVTGGDVSVEAFDRFSATMGPDGAEPVEGVGDRATFSWQAGALRVLSGSTLFVVRVTGSPGRSLDLATALARRVLTRLEKGPREAS